MNGDTQDLGTIGSTGNENLWSLGNLGGNPSGDVGVTQHFSSTELDNFLNSRNGGLATLMLVGKENNGKDVSFAPKELTLLPPPRLNSETVPEPASLALALLGFVGVGLAGRRRR